jgi:hypothetical protein
MEISFSDLRNLTGDFAHSRDSPEMFFDFDNAQMSHNFKPSNGIYCSPIKTYQGKEISDWESWVVDNNFSMNKYLYRFKISLKDDARVLVILTEDDILALRKKYSLGNLFYLFTRQQITSPVLSKHLQEIRSSLYYYTRHAICWLAVALDYNAVFVSAYLNSDDLLTRKIKEAAKISLREKGGDAEKIDSIIERRYEFDVNTLVVFDKSFKAGECTPFKFDLIENRQFIRQMNEKEDSDEEEDKELVFDNTSGVSL